MRTPFDRDPLSVDRPSYLMKNKETMNGQTHDRPCFYTFQDNSTGIYWMIPFSSQVSKFKKIYNTSNFLKIPEKEIKLLQKKMIIEKEKVLH